MKKRNLFLFIGIVCLLSSFLFARSPETGNQWQAGGATTGVELESDGDLVPMTDDTGSLGSATYRWKGIHATSATLDNGTILNPTIKNLITKHDTSTNLAAKSSGTYTTNEWYIKRSTGSLVTSTGVVRGLGINTQPGDAARNLRASFTCLTSSEVFKSTNIIVCSVDIEGLDARGNRIYETITASGSAPIAAHVSNNAFSMVFGSTWTRTEVKGTDWGANADITTLILNLGSGDVIGLEGDIDEAGDVWKATVANVDEISDFTFNAVYDTWTHSDVPDGTDDYDVYYRIDSE